MWAGGCDLHPVDINAMFLSIFTVEKTDTFPEGLGMGSKEAKDVGGAQQAEGITQWRFYFSNS